MDQEEGDLQGPRKFVHPPSTDCQIIGKEAYHDF